MAKKFRWIIGSLFVLSGLGSYPSSPATGIFAVLLGLFVIPPITQLVANKMPFEKKGKYITTAMLLCLYVFSASVPKTGNPQKAEVKSLTTQFKVTATIQPTNTIFYTPTAAVTPTIIVATLTLVPQTPIPTIFIPSNTPYVPPPTSVPAQQVNVVNTYVEPTQPPAVQNSGGGCNCSLTCDEISSCSEAYHQLNDCGCSKRDGDHDGVPCENLCR